MKPEMNHIEFINQLNAIGINFTNINGVFELNRPFVNEKEYLTVKDLAVTSNSDRIDPVRELIRMAIDTGGWKHSWHNEIEPENYNKFRGIIQDLIIQEAKVVQQLMATYFVVGKEISDLETANVDFL